MAQIDFYFDFLSPYSYLANCRLPALAAEQGYTINYLPIDLKAAKLAAGNDGPATAQIPAKMRYAFADFMRWSAHYGVPISFDGAKTGAPDPTRANIGTYYAIDRGQAQDYVTALWLATFGHGGNMGDEVVLSSVAEEMGWDAADFLAFTTSDAAATRYADGNTAAQAKGVFGAPIMAIGDELWWGNDRLDFVAAYLAAHPA